MAPKKVATHPPYSAMVKDALLALKERNGSSPAALKKKIGEQHPSLPTGWEKVLSTQLRNLVKSGKLVKVCSPRQVPGWLTSNLSVDGCQLALPCCGQLQQHGLDSRDVRKPCLNFGTGRHNSSAQLLHPLAARGAGLLSVHTNTLQMSARAALFQKRCYPASS